MEKENGKRVFILSHKPPYPKVDGGCVAMAALLELVMEAGFHASYYCLGTPKHPFWQEAIPAALQQNIRWHTSFINTRPAPQHLFSKLFSQYSYRAARFYQKTISQKIQEEIQAWQPEFIIFESLFSLVYFEDIRKIFPGKIFYRSHNVEYKIWESQIKEMTHRTKKIFFQKDLRQLQTFEEKIIREVDGILAISLQDAAWYRLHSTRPVHYLPLTFSFAQSRQEPVVPHQHNLPVLFHIGAMDWEPNTEGLSYFKNHIWPGLKKVFPGLHFHIAGKAMPESWKQSLPEGWENFGEVSDATTFMQERDILVVPLQSGSGIRVKILEAMALGKCIIATSKGIEGIPAIDKQHFFLADTPEEFISVMHQVIRNPECIKIIGMEARELVLRQFHHSGFLPLVQSLS